MRFDKWCNEKNKRKIYKKFYFGFHLRKDDIFVRGVENC